MWRLQDVMASLRKDLTGQPENELQCLPSGSDTSYRLKKNEQDEGTQPKLHYEWLPINL